MIGITLSWISIAAGFVAAGLWWKAAGILIPPFPDVGFDSDSSVFEPVRQALVDGANWNKWAAGVTGIAVAAQAAAVALQMLG